MTEEEQTVTIEMEPVSVPEDWIVKPTIPPEEEVPATPYDWSYLFPPAVELEKIRPVTAPPEKELIVNVETTDAKPWEGRIVSIAYIDLSASIPEVNVIIDEDEEKILNEFLNWFDVQAFTKLIGFKLTFDHRFIFAKAMLYRRKADKWAKIKLRDIKQILDQVKEEYVYFPSKLGTLDDWGKHLLGYGKLGTQANFLKQYLAKNWSFVVEFSRRQVLLTHEIYSLLRYSLGESSWVMPPERVETAPVETLPVPERFTAPLAQKQCKICLAYNKPEATVCEICGASL